MRSSGLFLLILLMAELLHAQGERYNFSRLDISDGLSNNQVNSILKDNAGFVWFGTMSGLNRYDNYGFKIFRNKLDDSTTISDNYVSGIFQLPDDQMLVITRGGANIYNPKTERFNRDVSAYLKQHSLPQGTIHSVVRDQKQQYWFVYDSLGIASYHEPSRKVTTFSHLAAVAGTLATNTVTALQPDSRGNIWLIHSNGIIEKLNPQSEKIEMQTTAFQKMISGNFNFELFIDSDDDLWLWKVNEPGGAYLFDQHDNTLTVFSEGNTRFRINNNLITGIIQDAKGMIWIGTDHGGVNLVDKSNNFQVDYLVSDAKNTKGLAQNSIYTIYKDAAGMIWIGTFKQGVNYLDQDIAKFTHYRHIDAVKQSLPFDDVNRFIEDKTGNLWIGSNGGGLIYFDRRKQTFKQYVHDPNDPNSISNNVIVSLWIDHRDKLWIGTYLGGLNCFDGKKFIRYRHNEQDPHSLIDDRVWEIYEDSKKNLWIGTLAGGLDLFDRQNNQFIHHRFVAGRPSPIQSNYISALIEDRQQNLWIGTAHGLAVFENGTGRSIHYVNTANEKYLSNNNVISLLEDKNGRIWIGTREGLTVFDPATKKFRIFYQEDGLPDNTILSIVEDNNGNLWITTPNGLCNLMLHHTETLTSLSFSVVNYDVMNNLQGREFNDNAGFRTKSGEILVGGPFGFNVINPSAISAPAPRAKIVITNLQVLNKEIVAGQSVNNRVLLPEAVSTISEIRLKYIENIFTIEVAALNVSHGSIVKYAYKLEGFNDDWVLTDDKHRRITYTNLDPGAYTLKVRALNSQSIWSDEKQLNIIIAAPFWRTPLAFVLYAFGILSALFVARKITLERAHMRFEYQQQRKEAERVQMLDRMKTKFFTNVSHEFRTPLSLIITPLDKIIRNTSDSEQKKQLHLVHRNAKRLLNLVNQLLDFRKLEVKEFKLYPANGDIVRFIREISYSFSDIAEKKNISFDFHSNVESLEIHFDKDKIEKIMFNLLSNAYKYTHDSGVVWVHLTYSPETDNSFTIEVGDTGIGIPADKHEQVFERFFQHDTTDPAVQQGSGIGLAITKEFVKLHDGTITVQSEPEKGSVFKVVLPVRNVTPNAPVDVVTSPETESVAEPKNSRKKTILLVEDNEDFRFYLKDNLKGQYDVTEAVNGKDGWEKARSLKPDLIVSDIMMPLMSGIELAHKLKHDGQTAHIPIILLTAMGSEELQMEGYQKGVNDYIAKPFTFEILASRIKNLLGHESLLKRQFNKQAELNPSLLTITPPEEQFISQAVAVVEENIGNPDFSVEELSRRMFISRVALYKKILALTGKGPLEFIRTIRLKRGAQLLEQRGLTIAEIAYEVGFNNPKTFSRYFKEEFQMLPSQYQESKGKN